MISISTAAGQLYSTYQSSENSELPKPIPYKSKAAHSAAFRLPQTATIPRTTGWSA